MSLPYKGMVQEFLSKSSWGGLSHALRHVRESWLPKGRSDKNATLAGLPSARPICIVEASDRAYLYPPALDAELRAATAKGQVIWVRTIERKAPEIVNMLLASGLCEGVLLHGLENFTRASPAGIWGRRWQLSAQQGGSDLIWLHEKAVGGFLLGFDVRLEWMAPGRYEIRKGHGLVEKHIADRTHRETARAS